MIFVLFYNRGNIEKSLLNPQNKVKISEYLDKAYFKSEGSIVCE
jgi:hypothetical protein